ncbi:MAG: hypothetical protein S4CHLAM6_00200 [Chlamydiae bacterium]|nr:hypothetical protein [Chlamydiota bacterium]
MKIVGLVPELKHMLRNFVLYLILSPIFAYAALNLCNYLKKTWKSESKLKQWISLTVVIFIMYVAFCGL